MTPTPSTPSVPPSQPDWDRVARYLAGEATPEDAKAVEQFLAEHPDDARVIATLDQATRNAAQKPVDVEAALRRVKARAAEPARPASRFATFTSRFEAIAAAAAIILVAGVFVWRRATDTKTAPVAQTYATAVGQIDSVALSDGSQMVIGPATRVRVGAGGREVELAGEAQFTVRHDERRPFTVRAGSAIVRDIGTRFTVRADSADGALRVAVTEGRVAVIRGTDSLLLDRGDVASGVQSGKLEVQRGVATDADLAWTQGRLVFRDTPLSAVAADLRRWYGVQLRVTDSSLLRRHYTGSFAGEPVDRVLSDIGLAFGARVERRGDTAYFRASPPAR